MVNSEHMLCSDRRSAKTYRKKPRHMGKIIKLNSEEAKMAANSLFITALLNHVELTRELMQQLESCSNNLSQ